MANFYKRIQESPAAPSDWVASDQQKSINWQTLREKTEQYAHQFAECGGCKVGVAVRPLVDSIAVFAALDRLGATAILMDGSRGQKQCQQSLMPLGGNHLLVADANGSFQLKNGATAGAAQEPAGGVTILTSGTEGQPKAARHTWESLLRPVRDGMEPQRWLLSYRLHLYAGLQVLLQSLVTGGGVCMPGEASPAETVPMLMANGVQFASATPSYWRRLLLFASRNDLQKLELRQITLGGEAVDQPLLDQLQQAFPNARVIHIYATTELGRCFSVSDGKAGFPISFLDDNAGRHADLRIEDGQLMVRSKNRMDHYLATEAGTRQGFDDEGWFATGDQVEVVGERVYFAGRLGDMINVGGNKVRPLQVENEVRQVPGVADVRIYGQTSSIAGELVACEIVIGAGFDPSEVQQAVAAHCRENLSQYQWPRLIQIVERLPLSDAGKTRRRA